MARIDIEDELEEQEEDNGIQHRLILEEQETHVLVDKIESYCTVDTSIPSDWNKLNKLGWEVLSIDRYRDGKVRSVIFRAPKKFLSFRTAGTSFCEELSTGRTMSEEHKKALQEGLKNSRKKSSYL